MRALALALVVVLPSVASAKLELKDIQAAHGPLGPERKGTEYVSGDQVFYRYTIAGFRTDADGRLRGELRLTVTDAKGKAIFNRDIPLQEVVGLGGTSIPGMASFDLGEDVPPGEYELAVRFTDLLSKESDSFSRKFTCKKEEFALVQVRFYHDEAAQAAARPGGVVSQTLYMKMKGIGFDRSTGEIDVEMTITVLDDAGKPVMPKPIRAAIHSEKPEEVKKIDRLGLSGAIALNRPGQFVLRISLADKLAKKEVAFETPLVVTPR